MIISILIKLLRTFTLLIFISSVIYGQASSESILPPYQLSEMKVVPYSRRTNSFLAEIKNDRAEDFWNELNLSLFLSVQVSGKAGSYSSNRRVEITAYEGGRLILKRVARLGVIDESTGTYYVPIWLYGPFCQQVIIKARVIGQSRDSMLQRKLGFLCGE